MPGKSGGYPQISIDDFDLMSSPPQALGSLSEGILQTATLLIGDHLVRRGLPDVDHGLLLQML